MEEIVLEPKDAVDWSYRGEGAVNLVLAYTGSSPSFVSLLFESVSQNLYFIVFWDQEEVVNIDSKLFVSLFCVCYV